MSMPTSPTRLLTCDDCGATLPYEPEHAGRKCRCGKCGKLLIVPGNSPKPPQKSTPEYVNFNCLLCDTHLTARVEDVGLQAKCPDCGKLTKVPLPPKPRPKKSPQAMHGQQYGLWGVDEAPTPDKIAAKQPKFYAVWCQVCDTLMHAQEKQLGEKLTCPDCGAKTPFNSLPKEKKTESALVPEGEEYQLDEAIELPKRPVYKPPVTQGINEFDAQQEKLRQEYREKGPMPKIPLIGGVHKMLFRSPLPEATLVMAFGLALESWFLANAMANVSGMMLAFVMLSYATTAFFGLLCLMAASAFWLAILKESSEGNDRLYHPPGILFMDWAGEFFYFVMAASMAVTPGMLFWKFAVGIPSWAGPLATTVCGLGLFPLFLLSQLENGSPMEFFSSKVARTLLQRPGQWFLFYSETFIVLAGCAAAVFGLSMLSSWMLAVTVLLIAGASFLYFRLLGRLAWWLAESMAVEEEDQ